MPRTFRSKNLTGGMLVADKLWPIIPKLKICLLRTVHWLPCTCIGATRPCAARSVYCEVMTKRVCAQWSRCAGPSVARFGQWQFDAELYRRQLAELKADLRVALDELQAHERDIADLVKEGSRLAMDELEDGLKDAVRQIENMKRQR